MEYAKRNLGTLSLIAFAVAAFLTEIAGTLPPGVGARITEIALVVLGAARGFVLAAQALSSTHDSDGRGE